MLLIVLVCSLALSATGQQEQEDWIDPYDMLNYDASTKTMRKPAEPRNYQNVPTKRRQYDQDQDSSQPELTLCKGEVEELKRQIEDQKKKITALSQQPTCNPVFRRFLSRLLKEIQRVGLPSDTTDMLYDAKIRLSRQSMTEIQKLLDGEESWRTGALDDAISRILVDLKPHDYEAWKWRFEHTFGVELYTLLQAALFVLVLMAIVGTQLWSIVSWFVQIKRLLIICFLVSIVWNWFYLYKIAFAEHQNNIVKMDSVNEKCTGMKKIDWSDNLRGKLYMSLSMNLQNANFSGEWMRSTFTLQDDPCKKYYEVLMVNPILLVPPTKAISVTITTFFTEPLKHFGQGISEFLQALLKDMPITLQIPVLLTVMFTVLACFYGSVQGAFRYGITAPLRRRRRRDPPLPPANQPQPPLQRIEDGNQLAGGDAPQQAPRQRLKQNQIRQRRFVQDREEPPREVESLSRADIPFSDDEVDGEWREGSLVSEHTEHSLSAAESDPQSESESDNQQDTQEKLAGESASSGANRGAEANEAQSKTKPTDSTQEKAKPLKADEKVSRDESHSNGTTARSQPAQPAQNLEAPDEDRTFSDSLTHVETLGLSVQETFVE